MRKRLAKLGYMTNFDELDEYKALVFSCIDAEIDEYQDRERKRAVSKSKSKR